MITLPDSFAADYLVQVEDSHTAELWAWRDDAWNYSRPLGAEAYRFEYSRPSETDVLLPFADLGIGDPATAQVKLVALASEEEALRIWAAIPDKNPLNSARAVNPVAHGGLDRPYTLMQQIAWPGLGPEVCANNGYVAGSDLRISLAAEPGAVALSYLADGLAGVLVPGMGLPVDENGHVSVDVPLPAVERSAWVGCGTPVTYTLTYTNAGTAPASGVAVDLIPHDLTLQGSAQREIGEVPPGTGGHLQVLATVDCSSDVDKSVELDVGVSDARHGAFDWLWAQHSVDTAPPVSVTIESPKNFVGPGSNVIAGRASDEGGLARIELEVTPDGQQAQLINCPVSEPTSRHWACQRQPSADAEEFSVRARAVDVFGNVSGWTAFETWTLDADPPTLHLDDENPLADGFLTSSDGLLRGSVEDDHKAAGARLCALPEGEGSAICTALSTIPGESETRLEWTGEATVLEAADGVRYDYVFTGYDHVGNYSAPITVTVTVDLVGPEILVDNPPSQIPRGMAIRILSGTVSDGSGVQSLRVRTAYPDGSVARSKDLAIGDGGEWEYKVQLEYQGHHTLVVEARDVRGNATQVGPIELEVLPNKLLPPHWVWPIVPTPTRTWQ